MSDLTFNDFPFLKELGLAEDNLGVYYDGKWTGNGAMQTCMNPTTGKPIARVRMGSIADYKECIKASKAEKERW